MSFIGNIPAEAFSATVKDTLSGNGSDTDFPLSVPATTNSVEVFVENVQQEPTTAYTISGTTLSFTAPPVTGTDNIYVIHRGPAVQTVVPPAGVAIDASTVTASSTISATGNISTEGDLKVEVASGGIYTVTGTDTATNRTLTLPDEAGTVLTGASDLTGVTGVPTANTPNFSAKRSGDQTGIPNASHTVIEYNATLYDSDSGFDITTGQYTVPTGKGGKYYIRGGFRTNASGSMTRCVAYIYVNGSAVAEYNNPQGTNGETASAIASVLDLSADDVVDIRIFQNSGSAISAQDGTKSLFFGFRLSE